MSSLPSSDVQGETGGTLDPQPFHDPASGKRYLVYKVRTSQSKSTARLLTNLSTISLPNLVSE